MSVVASHGHPRAGVRGAIRDPARRISWPGVLVALLAFATLAGAAWWVAHDGRVPDSDTGKHALWALDIRDAIKRGDLLYAFNSFTPYPPLVHTVGGIAVLLAGVDLPNLVLGADIVFVPLLVLALYRTGWLVSGPRAGVLAVLFATGAPLLIAQSHVFVLELPEMALVAAALWGLVASERFARPLPAVATGVACGFGMLAKPTFPFFIAGALAVVLVRGGLRNRRGLVLFTLGAVAIGAPWYIRHFRQLGQTLGYATRPPNPPRFSVTNAMWFTWDQLNGQLFAPLYAFAVAGALWVAWGWRQAVVRQRRGLPPGRGPRSLEPSDYTPELVVGGIVAYLGLTYGMSLHAPYYSLPALPYEAILGTIWIGTLRPRAGAAATAALAAVAAFNFVSVGIHPLGSAAVRLPGEVPGGFTAPRRLTLWRSGSWPVGPPQGDGRLLDVFRTLRARGVLHLEVDATADWLDFDATGVLLLARIAGLPQPAQYSPSLMGPHDVFVLRARGPEPWPVCRRLTDGSGILVIRRDRTGPRGFASACPA
jgi:4-amino-4-deoxy-L-arabinose transferase-like glycosyltransferase